MRAWTTSEAAFLRASAGRLPAAEIAGALGRSTGAVRMMAARQGISLAVPRLAWCPACARPVPELAKGGVCEACALEAAAARARRTAAARLAEAQAKAAADAAASEGRKRMRTARQGAARKKKQASSC